MSAIAGVVRFDGVPADPPLVARMLDSMSHRGPDGRGIWTSHAAALGHLALHAAPESAHERQPLVSEDGSLTLVFEGRVDNRDELKAMLDAGGPPLRTDTDAEIVLLTCQRWGAGGAERILGDFAFALWDGRQRRLLCARDIAGIRPFYYRITPHGVQFATELQALLQDVTFPVRPNEAMVAEHLVGLVTSRTETPIDGILRLPAAHVLEVTDNGPRVSRYWQIDPAREIRYRSDGEYEEQLRELFTRAVRCRLRASGPVGILLSGGLDSSSIVGAARAMQNDGGVHTQVETYSMTFPGRSCDEADYIAAVNDRAGVTAHVLTDGPMDWSLAAEESVRCRDVPTAPGSLAAEPLRELARRHGVRVLLSGLGGDEWLMGSPAYYADLLRGLQLRRLAHNLARDARSPAFVGYRAAARMAVRPLVPAPAWRLLKRAVRHDVVPDWIEPAFAARTSLRERLSRYTIDLPFPTVARRESYQEAMSGLAMLALEQIDRSLAWHGLEERHPFHDRRLLEFAFALPADQLWRNGRPKSLMRRAFDRWLPPVVRDRLWHPDYSHLVHDAVGSLAGTGLLNDPTIGRRGWVSASRLHEACRRAVPPGTPLPQLRPLWAACAVELWVAAEAAPPTRQARQSLGPDTQCRTEERSHEQPVRV